MSENKTLESERLFYRPFQLEDAETMQKYNNEASRRKWFYFQEPDCLTLDFCVKQIEKNIALWSRKINILEDHFDFAVILKATGEYIGCAGISGEGREHADLGYCICEKYQGNGYATEAAKTVVEWGFNKLREIGADLIIAAEIEHGNAASCKVAENAGLTFAYDKEYVAVYEIRREK